MLLLVLPPHIHYPYLSHFTNVRHTSVTPLNFRIHSRTHSLTHSKTVTIPHHGTKITIAGHQAKILPTDFRFGRRTLLYSTAEVLTHATIDAKEILALWVPTSESGEFVVTGAGAGSESASVLSCRGCEDVKIIPQTTAAGDGEGSVAVSFRQNAGMSIVGLPDGTKVVLLDRQSAYRFWSPSLSADPQSGPEDNSESIIPHPPFQSYHCAARRGETKQDTNNTHPRVSPQSSSKAHISSAQHPSPRTGHVSSSRATWPTPRPSASSPPRQSRR